MENKTTSFWFLSANYVNLSSLQLQLEEGGRDPENFSGSCMGHFK